MLTLKGRTAVVSGYTGHIGEGAVKNMVEGGMNVVLLTHNLHLIDNLVNSLQGKEGKCEYYTTDVPIEQAYADIAKKYGSLDVVLINTGNFYVNKPFTELLPEDWERYEKRNFSFLQQIIKAMPYLEKSRAGRIVLTTCAASLNGFLGESIVDAIARGGELSMTYYLARELADKNITVNCIDKSAMVNDHPVIEGKLDTQDLIPYVPMKRLGRTEEFAAAIEYLVSEEASFVTGQVIHVSGGLAIGT